MPDTNLYRALNLWITAIGGLRIASSSCCRQRPVQVPRAYDREWVLLYDGRARIYGHVDHLQMGSFGPGHSRLVRPLFAIFHSVVVCPKVGVLGTLNARLGVRSRNSFQSMVL